MNQPAAELNRDCHCVTVDPVALRRELTADPLGHEALARLDETHPNLFAAVPIFVSRRHFDAMAELVAAIEEVIALPAYQEAALAWAPPIARFAAGPAGVLMGYDFHLADDGPRLIEINTNAGGALLNTVLARAQRACCDAVSSYATGPVPVERIGEQLLAMFAAEWQRQRPGAAPGTIVIVDDEPQSQYLYPEFLLFAALFRQSGMQALIADARELSLRDGCLWRGDERIDLVYNRLTDFALAEPAHACLRDAYLSGATVVTPHPRAHALYADKRNLTLLTDDGLLGSWGVAPAVSRLLGSMIPRTTRITPANADAYWAERRRYFFKPAVGFGSRAAYRGDKLTRRVWEEIRSGEYVAQEFIAPSRRTIRLDGETVALKLDIRNYVYDRRVLLAGARIWEGQTTNFRTPGGGFATVFCPPA
jgi:hypothetical protein